MPEVRLITPITRQSTKKMQVAAYCRVSPTPLISSTPMPHRSEHTKNISEHATIGNWWTFSPMKGSLE